MPQLADNDLGEIEFTVEELQLCRHLIVNIHRTMRARREELGMSLNEVAAETEIGLSILRNLENHVNGPSVTTLLRCLNWLERTERERSGTATPTS